MATFESTAEAADGAAGPSITQLLRTLELEPLGGDQFRAQTEQKEGRLFGGLTLAQSIMAAGKTITSGDIHSLHAYFLRAGRPAQPIDYDVERIRDGRNFTTRRVTARQSGDIIFEASISFVATEPGIEHQREMPPVLGPEGLAPWNMGPDPEAMPESEKAAYIKTHGSIRIGPRRRRGPGFLNPMEIRSGPDGQSKNGDPGLPQRTVWIRPAEPLPESPIIHAAAMAYASDSGVVGTVAQHYSAWGQTASLDHAIWYHHPPRFDDWLLYTSESPVGKAARALIQAHMYRRDGTLVASVSQEGLFRMGKASPES